MDEKLKRMLIDAKTIGNVEGFMESSALVEGWPRGIKVMLKTHGFNDKDLDKDLDKIEEVVKVFVDELIRVRDEKANDPKVANAIINGIKDFILLEKTASASEKNECDCAFCTMNRAVRKAKNETDKNLN